MYKYKQDYVEKKIYKLHQRGKLKNKDIYLFGVSNNTRRMIRALRDLGYSPLQVADNDKRKQNSHCSGLEVVSPEAIRKHHTTIILIHSYFWREMRLQIMNYGFSKSQIYVFGLREKTLGKQLFECWMGEKIYKRLVKKYGNIPFFLCPYTGTGDIYLIGVFWKEYITKEKISRYGFFVISNACRKVASLFEIENVEILNQKESSYLVQYYNLCPTEVNLKILNDGWAPVGWNQSEWLRGYKGMYFMELFRKFVFGLPDTSIPEHPLFPDLSGELEKLFNKYKLVEKKTVVLSPYSNTLADLPNGFWEEITTKLLKKGYVVCTNSSGAQEPAIAGSIPVFFPLHMAPQFIEKAGIFIGVRSGLCDVASGADAKKIILYDAGDRFYNSSAFEYFSLNHMGLCSDAIEIEYQYCGRGEIVSKVIGLL